MEYSIHIGFKATNNEIEYEALLAGLRVTIELGIDFLDAFNDFSTGGKSSLGGLPCKRYKDDGLLGPFLRCLRPEEGEYVMKEIHEGICENHSRARSLRKFLIVAIDYFTKWVEAESRAKIIEKNARDFIWNHIICRFGISKVIISDNARQFDNDKFKLFCSDLAIAHHFSSPGHPQANGQVEVTN
ncbi:hypothetical protein Acr_00g0014820 [Actinidia rufa]|uniref:Integrase catalytic domain-containing protein n=1 Tax=Actinidia rufa TaxID=165716 RepID=A0A7J0DBT5_9ERIC|nr:hypothetical protein Acr_00g0014820 [Actinidia rufa]